MEPIGMHTVVTLSYAILYPSPLGQVGNLGPIFVGICGSRECTACRVVGRISVSRLNRSSGGVRIRLWMSSMTTHGGTVHCSRSMGLMY